jgi:hypothetical protein
MSPPSLHEAQAALAAALREPGARPAAAASTIEPWPRLEVYRNNRAHNYHAAIASAYPVVERLVGRAFLRQAAYRYAEQVSSRSGDLNDFGARFAEFLACYPPARVLPYLRDVARLEWSVERVFHAADEDALSPARLAQIDPEAWSRLRLVPRAAAALMASDYPVARIWAVNQPGFAGDPAVDLDQGGERLLIVRPLLEVCIEPLGAGEYAWLAALMCSSSLAQACERALAVQPGFELGPVLLRHLQLGTFVAAQIPSTPAEAQV